LRKGGGTKKGDEKTPLVMSKRIPVNRKKILGVIKGQRKTGTKRKANWTRRGGKGMLTYQPKPPKRIKSFAILKIEGEKDCKKREVGPSA